MFSKSYSRNLIFTIFITISIFFLTSTIFQFYSYFDRASQELDQNMKAVIEGLEDRLNSIDKIYYALEIDLDEKMISIIKEMEEAYISEGSVKFDLHEIALKYPGFDLYIINSDNVIVETTDSDDIGLDFGKIGSFANFLDGVRASGTYTPDRVNLSSKSSMLKKYAYKGSYDHVYVFEVGYDMGVFDEFLSEDSLTNLISSVTSVRHILDIKVYNVNGVEYGGSFQLNSENTPIRFDGLQEALNTKKMVTLEKKMKYGFSNTYYYIPFMPEYSKVSDPKLILEIGYTDKFIRLEIIYQMLFQLVLIVSFAALIVFMFKEYDKNVLKPIIVLYEGMNSVDQNKLNKIPELKVSSELNLVGTTFNDMIDRLENAFSQLNEYNENLEVMVATRTEELKSKNDELELTIYELEQVQAALIDKERIQTINKVLIEMSHRLNTPLGNSISSISYAQWLIDKNECLKDEEALKEALILGGKSLHMAIAIMNALKVISELNSNYSLEDIRVLERISDVVYDYCSRTMCTDKVRVVCSDEITFEMNPTLFENIIIYLLELSDLKNENTVITITVELTENHIEIQYFDDIGLNNISEEGLGDPFAHKPFQTGLTGLELFIVNSIVDQLNGEMVFIRNEPGSDYILIKLPRI